MRCVCKKNKEIPALLTLPSDAVCLAASRGLQRLTVVLLMMKGLASPRGISAKPKEQIMILFHCTENKCIHEY